MKKENVIERLCKYLGRQNSIAKFLDYLANYMFPTADFSQIGVGQTFYGMQNVEDEDVNLAKPILMARPPAGLENFHGEAPINPHSAHEGVRYRIPPPTIIDRLTMQVRQSRSRDLARASRETSRSVEHASAICANPLYRGMHGMPCSQAGGTDNMCPRGTVSGWYWSYEVPTIGRVYYVDCCGGNPNHHTFCNWTSEPNWCLGHGRAAAQGIQSYHCTLAIREADLNVVSNGSGGYIVSGVDPT